MKQRDNSSQGFSTHRSDADMTGILGQKMADIQDQLSRMSERSQDDKMSGRRMRTSSFSRQLAPNFTLVTNKHPVHSTSQRSLHRKPQLQKSNSRPRMTSLDPQSQF